MSIDISIIIPVKNGQRRLDATLKAIFSQEINIGFEVIIIDSGSQDGSLDTVRKYPVRLYQIEEKDFNHGSTRNLGIFNAQGKYIVLLTQDAVPYDNHWLKELIDNLELDKEIAGVYSHQIPFSDSHPLTQIRTQRFFTALVERRESQIENWERYHQLSAKEKYRFCNFDNVSSGIKKSVWFKFPFSETEFGEDIEWAKCVLEAGYKIVYEPESAVYHSHDFSISDWYKRNRLNSKKLHFLFGVNTVNNFYTLIVFFAKNVFRDLYYFCINKNKIKWLSIALIPAFAFAEAIGQYKGIRDATYS